MTNELWIYTCKIEVVILFLMLVSDTITADLGSVEVLNITSLSLWRWDFLYLTLFLFERKKKQLENKSNNLLPGENLWLNRSKDLKMLFNLLLASMIGLLIFNFCFGDKFSINS